MLTNLIPNKLVRHVALAVAVSLAHGAVHAVARKLIQSANTENAR